MATLSFKDNGTVEASDNGQTVTLTPENVTTLARLSAPLAPAPAPAPAPVTTAAVTPATLVTPSGRFRAMTGCTPEEYVERYTKGIIAPYAPNAEKNYTEALALIAPQG